MFGLWLFMIVLVICITILCGCIMYEHGDDVIELLSEHEVYKNRLDNLEKQIKSILEGNK